MWRAFDETGRLAVPRLRRDRDAARADVLDARARRRAVHRRASCSCGVQHLQDLAVAARRAYEEPVIQAPRLPNEYVEANGRRRDRRRGRLGALRRHGTGTARGSACRSLFTVLTAVAVVVASLFEILPTFLIRSNVPTIASVKPYTPLELDGPRHLHRARVATTATRR